MTHREVTQMVSFWVILAGNLEADRLARPFDQTLALVSSQKRKKVAEGWGPTGFNFLFCEVGLIVERSRKGENWKLETRRWKPEDVVSLKEQYRFRNHAGKHTGF